MFESLQQSLDSALKTLSGKGKLSESNMREGLEKVQQALLEADVSFPVVKDFIARVTEEAVGERVLKSLNPTQQLVGVVHQELVNLMGPVDHSLKLRSDTTVLMLCGLQGSGKTTTCGKLARMLKERGRKPFLVAADLQRPAAIHQLHVLGEQLGVPVYSEQGSNDPVAVCQNAVKRAKQEGADVVILDTAGRLHIDEELMAQLRQIDRRLSPEQVYLVVDGMTGQDAVNSAKAFNEALELDGVIMTKLDGDARGGAALSIRAVTGAPIFFVGTGEKPEALEPFHPDRMASRILGQGDVLSLIEKVEKAYDQKQAEQLEKKLRKNEFTLEDFRDQLQMVKKLGSMGDLIGMIPGMKKLAGKVDPGVADSELKRIEAIINSMTKEERRNDAIINGSRRKRIALGSGTNVSEVNRFLKQYAQTKKMMKKFTKMGPGGLNRFTNMLPG